MNLSRICFLMAVTGLLYVLPGLVWAEDRRAGSRNVLVLSTVPEFRPFVWKQGEEIRGIDYDIVREMCRRMDLVCHVDFHPWKRVLARIEKGLSDGGFTGFKIPEREAYAHFLSHPLHYSTYRLFVRTGEAFEFSTIRDLYGKTIGLMRGFKINAEFHEAAEKDEIRIIEVNSLAQNIRVLSIGRVDAIAANYHIMRTFMKKMIPAPDIISLPVPITPPRPSYLMISRKWTVPGRDGILVRMDETLKSMYDDGTIDKINADYLD